MSTELTPDDREQDVSRREFLGTATLTTAGVATGLSVWLLRSRAPDLSEYRKPENQVGLGYIGVGNRGQALLRSSLQVPGSRPLAVAEVRPDMLASAVKDIVDYKKSEGMADYKVATYTDYRRLLDNKDVEAVFIATPHYLHGPMAIDALEAGKHVYCEKAMAFTIGENQDIYNLVNKINSVPVDTKKHQIFQVGHQRHYSPLYLKVKEMVDMDLIGDVCGLRAQWNRNDEVRRPCPDPELEKIVNWRLYSEYSGGLTTEFASHQIDVANWVLGTHPDSVCGYGGLDWYTDGRDTTDNIHVLWNYKVPVLDRDKYGRIVMVDGKPVIKKGEHRNVRFMYMSLMQNAYLGPSELIMGQYGTLEVSLLGGEFFKEDKAREDPNRIAEGTDPKRPLQRKILKTGSTVKASEGGLPRRRGDVIRPEKDRSHWVEFTKEIAGAYDTQETLLAVGGYLDCIRLARGGKPYQEHLKADVVVGLWGAVPALMANIAMRENRTVYWSEFFGPDETASIEGKAGSEKRPG
jgi:predicted dehydrogenase